MFEVRPNPNALTASQTEEKGTQNFEMQQFYLLEKKNAPSKRHEISLTFTLFSIALSRLVLLLNYYYKIVMIITYQMPIVLAVLFLATDDESVISRQFQNNNNENIMSVRPPVCLSVDLLCRCVHLASSGRLYNSVYLFMSGQTLMG